MSPEEELQAHLRELRRMCTGQLRPKDAFGELGNFVEAVHGALAQVVGFDRSLGIDTWPSKLATVGVEVPGAVYQEFHAIYGVRNMVAHNNEERPSTARVRRALDALDELVPDLAGRLGERGPPFVSELCRVQTSAAGQRRATLLEAALVGSAEAEAISTLALHAAARFDSRLPGFLARATPAGRLKRCIRELAENGGGGAACPLRALAIAIQADHPSAGLAAWIVDDLAHAEPPEPERLNVLRIEVDRTEDGWQISGADVIHPADPRFAHVLPPFPIDAATREDLAAAVIRVFNAAGTAARSLGLPSEAREYVLQVAVHVECATEAWDALRPARLRPSLTETFRCVTVEPMDDDEWVATDLLEPVRPAHLADVWEPLEPEDLRDRAGDRRVLLAGLPVLEHTVDGRSTLFWAMDDRAAALVTDHPTAEDAVADLLPDGAPRSWGAVLGTVRDLRRARRTLKVFWTDARYRPPRAHPL